MSWCSPGATPRGVQGTTMPQWRATTVSWEDATRQGGTAPKCNAASSGAAGAARWLRLLAAGTTAPHSRSPLCRLLDAGPMDTNLHTHGEAAARAAAARLQPLIAPALIAAAALVAPRAGRLILPAPSPLCRACRAARHHRRARAGAPCRLSGWRQRVYHHSSQAKRHRPRGGAAGRDRHS